MADDLGADLDQLLAQARQRPRFTDMPSLTDKPDYPLTLRQADQARSDFAAIEGDLQFVMSRARPGADTRLSLSDIATDHRQL